MKRVLVGLLAGLAFLASLLALAPASWLDLAVQRASRGMAVLAEPRGTVWRGSGVIQVILPSGAVETLDGVRWQIDPWPLLTARLHLAMVSERDGKPVLDITLAPGSVTIGEVRLDAPAALLGTLSPTLREAGISGRIALRASAVKIDREATTGSGELLWLDAGSSLTAVHPLGTYRVELKGAGRGLGFTLATLGGALGLAGSGQWQPGAPLAFSATATPAADQARQLAPLLRIIGKEAGGERYEIVLDQNAGLAGR
jgi:general secretion pathway protein N